MKKPVTIEERRRRKRLLITAGGVVAAVIAALIIWLKLRPAPDAPPDAAPGWTDAHGEPSPDTSPASEPTLAPDVTQPPRQTNAPEEPAAVTTDRSLIIARLEFDAYNRKAYGKMLIRFINNTASSMYSIPLALKNTVIDSVVIQGASVGFNRSADTLDIPFAIPLEREGRCDAFVSFTIDWSDSAEGWDKIELPRLAYDTTYDIILYVDAPNGIVSRFPQEPDYQQQAGSLMSYRFKAERISGFAFTLAGR